MKHRAAFCVLLFLLASCAPPGYHYGTWSITNPGQAFQLQPNDTCQDQRLVSPGALQLMNASVGKPNGFPKQVASIDSISSNGYGPPLGGFDPGPPDQFRCYETVTFNDGSRQTGKIDIIDETNGLLIVWTPQPPPITPQQRAKNELAIMQLGSELDQCSDEAQGAMSQVSNVALQAQADGKPFDRTAYILNVKQALMSCQQAARQRYNSVVGGSP